ncbi:hypothetical protein GH714_004062 [Hevea brasiliensis]|uniref:E3 ubiquitin-protein ligase synoviolin-like TPR repeats domain-containing protein n=1 Tax=Hevea brasiliensis TaxID=3981 RepID=A0A6A6KHZ4_HEVBR|nr:hypothetical protein GH714_004062 [Hevea brasiliensis]
MMRLRTYASLSLVATIAVIYHAFNSRGQFYPAMVYLSTSKINLVLLLNMGLVIMCILWQLTKRVFLGSLREAEVERLNEQSWREVMEILFAITIFRQDFSVTFLAMVTALLLIKALHWYMILATTTVSTFVKYVFYVSDMLMEGQWEKKAVYTFYLELIRDLLHLSMYLCFFLVIFMDSTTSSGPQGSVGSVPDDNLGEHQARLQAAAAAASVYEKSFVYPSANSLAWSPGYVLLPQAQRPLADAANGESSREQAFIGQSQWKSEFHAGPSNLSLPQFPTMYLYQFRYLVPMQIMEICWAVSQTPSWKLRKSFSNSRLRSCKGSSNFYISQKLRKVCIRIQHHHQKARQDSRIIIFNPIRLESSWR